MRTLIPLIAFCLPLTAEQLAAEELSPLVVRGEVICDADGNVVVLRGFNLGNWLVNEIWMMPVVAGPAPDDYEGPTLDIFAHDSLWRVIQQRFGPDGRQKLQDAWRDAWLVESDFELISSSGFNCVRLPFIAENLLGEVPDREFTDIDPESLTAESLDWRRLDQALGWAAEHELYVILDLHGAPGRQSIEHHTGRQNVNRLWTDPNAQRLTERLWTLIAEHVAGNPTVAAVDLLNEPRALPSDREDENAAMLHAMHDRLYRAVRVGDPDRVVVIEDGYSGFNRMPQPAEFGWTNVIYSYHSYPENRERLEHTLSDWELNDCRQRGVPFYIGEFNLAMHHGAFDWPADLVSAVADMDAKGISWSAWNYKVVPGSPDWLGTHWGWYRNEHEVELLDPWHDDVDTLVRKMEAVETDNLQADPAWEAVVGER
jgi:endoglucanase